jgi:tRNA(fMet)-specific endonuclease VapC
MLILDTDTLTILQHPECAEYGLLLHRLDAASIAHAVCVTIVSVEEQLRGWLAYIAASRDLERMKGGYERLHFCLEDLRSREVVLFDDASIARFQDLRESRIRIGTLDLRIAAITLVHDATLISRNLRDFRKVPGLKVEDWTIPP